ncbi:MAG TPA: pit accessory protein [Rhodanobacteraceae bacterium]|nr:pit accessory protein [Rhodanobacteraceae bacterium]
MFSLQTLFGNRDKVMGLLHASSDAACEAARALDQMTRSGGNTAASMAILTAARRREKELAAAISEELVNTFVTVLDREDIEAMNAALYRIPKAVEKFAARYVLVSGHLTGIDFSPRTGILLTCTEVVASMVQELDKGLRIHPMRKLQVHLQALEGEADRLLLEPYGSLYLASNDPIRTTLTKDLFEAIEKAIDVCRDVGNVIYSIVLKNS